MARKTDDDGSLKRLGAGRWQTRDERFTIEPESGTWVVIDARQTDDLGLPLVRGPFASLSAAKAAIEAARSSEPAVSPLAEQIARHRERPAPPPARTAARAPKPAALPARPKVPEPPPPPPEPRWIAALEPAGRRRAHDLIERLAAAGAPDAEAIAEREISGKDPAVTSYAIRRALAQLGPGARPADVARLLVKGQDGDLRVGWRLVDDDGRPIELEA